jgi:nucleoside-diphosphate kinase
MRLSASQAAKPRNQIHAVFRIIGMLQREVSAGPKGRGGMALFYTSVRDSPRRNTLSQRTFSIIKPDAVRKGHSGAILAAIEKAGFKIVSIKRLSISKAQAEGFYHVHAARPFFGELTEFMSSGPIFPMVLEKDNAIADFRKLMGATNPAQAEEGTIRKQFASSIGENAIHGSDAEDTAAFEIGYFFAGYELK